jgi:flavin reductase (DIM6/NTAB) family NADH-FMN oxidoreductase RutF
MKFRPAPRRALALLATLLLAAGRSARPSVRRLATTVSEDGALVLDDAVATFDCTVHQEIAAGDHTIALLALHAVEDPGTALPLVFHRSAFGRLAVGA